MKEVNSTLFGPDGTDTEMLVGFLGELDAVFLPSRSWAKPRPANVYFARRDYSTSGLTFRCGGGDATARKAAERVVDALLSAGLVSLRRRGRGLRWRLTEAGDVRARGLVGLSGLDDALSALGEIRRLARGRRRDLWIRETALAGVRYEGKRASEGLMLAENMLLPALVRGFAESGADIEGRASYRLTSSGRAWLKGAEPPEDPFEPTEEVRRVYFQALRAEQARLGFDKPRLPSEIGLIRLPVSDPNL